MTDETKELTQDATPEGEQSSGEGMGSTSKETYTKDEFQKAISDLKSEHGREAKELKKQVAQKEAELTTTRTQLQQTNENLTTVESRLDELEKQGLEDSPEALKLYQRQKSLQDTDKKLKAEKAQFEAEKAQHAEEIRIARETQWDITVWGIASKYNVDATELKELGITSAEQLEKVASKMAKGSSGQAKQAKTPTSEFTPDSGIGAGGGEPTSEQLENMSVEQYAAYWRKREAQK